MRKFGFYIFRIYIIYILYRYIFIYIYHSGGERYLLTDHVLLRILQVFSTPWPPGKTVNIAQFLIVRAISYILPGVNS